MQKPSDGRNALAGIFCLGGATSYALAKIAELEGAKP